MSTQHRPLRARLEAKEKRPLDRAPAPIAPSPPAPLTITRAHEVSALAVGLLVLRHVEETGRTRLQEQAIGDALQRVTKHLNAEQMMRLEVEAYEVVDWLVGEDENSHPAPLVAEKRADGTIQYDPSSSIPDIVRAAAAQNFDLSITYYSSRRMEMNKRVISPKAIAAEVYVRAWCHERRDERIFRMSRIRSAVPVHGQAMKNPHFEHAVSEQQSVQQSLELERLSYDILKERKIQAHNTSEPSSTAEAPSVTEAVPRTPNVDVARTSQAPTDAAESVAAAKAPTQKSTSSTEQTAVEHKPQPKTSDTGGEALVLEPTPTDSELLAMERQQKRAEEVQEAQVIQEAKEDAQQNDDSQLSIF